jgi:type IV pilus assembly protein PilC
MYRHGVQILDIVDASARLVQMEPIKDLMIQCRSEISEGMSLSQSLGTKKYIPPLMQSFLLLGEETDDMVTPMEKLSEIYDNQVTYQIDCLISLVEPVFMTFSAILVGFVGLSLFLPVYSVISSMGV